MSLKKILAATGILLFASTLPASEALFQIRKTDKVPFAADGKPIASVWKQADTLSGFVIPQKASVESCISKAQMLYDNQNLYVYLQGSFSPSYRSDRTLQRNLFADNNFEFFFQPAPALNTYYQIAVSENNQIHVSVNKNKTELPGIKKQIFSEKDKWSVSLTIPFSAIGMKAPQQSQKVRFNICRYNIDMPVRKEEQSSFAVMDGSPNYHQPDQWNDAIMTPENGTPVTFRSHSELIKTNLLPNPGFDLSSSKYNNPDIQRVETAPLSDIWLIRATGKAYHFYTVWVKDFVVPGEEYTLRIRARRFGKEGALAATQIGRTADGKYGQVGSVFWGLPLTEDFQEYYQSFTPVKNVASLAFYRLGTKNNESGVEIENISLFKGKISSFEVRKLSRAGIKKMIPGTEFKFSKNLYGESPSPLKILVIGSNLVSLSDPRELFSGLNVQADMLTTTAKNADVYYTDDNPKEIQKKLKDNTYDLYMIGGRSVPEKIGKGLAKYIEENVKKGASLFLNTPAPYGNLAPLVKAAQLKQVPDNHYLKQGLPVEFHVRPNAYGNWKHDPLANFREGSLGKGKVVTGQTASIYQLFQIPQKPEEASFNRFPWELFNKAWLARILYYTAGKKTQSFGTVNVSGTNVKVPCHALPEQTAILWSVTGKNGEKAANGKASVKGGEVNFTLPDLSMNGNYVLTLHALDSKGKTVDYTAKTFEKSGPEITEVKDTKTFHKGNDEAEIAVSVKDFAPGMTLDWALEDFSGRILQTGSQKASASQTLKIPLKPLYTNLGNVVVSLKQKKRVLDMRRIPVVAQDRDKARLVDDFTPSMWNFGMDTPEESARLTNARLEEIGFRCYLMPFHGLGELASGMGVGGGFRGGGSTFCGWPQKNNIRAQQFNTADAHKRIAESAERIAKRERSIGIIHDTVCDEPNLVRPDTDKELDEHPENIAEYRKRMKGKYGSIENYNKRMGTNRKSFDEVGPARMAEARASGKFAEFIEWRNFNVDRWCEIIRIISESSKKGDPNSALSLYNSFGQGALGGNDFWKLLTKAGLNFSQEYTSMVYQGDNPRYDFDELYRSFRPDMRVWGFTGYYFSRDKSFFQPWWFALHRYGGLTWFATYAGMGSGGGGAWLNMLDYTGAYNEDAKNMQDSLKESGLLDGLGKLFLAYHWAKNEIAVYYSHDSMLLAFIRGKETKEGEIHSSGPLHNYFYSRSNIRYMLEELLYQYDFVAPEQITGGKLKDYKALFMPGISAMSDAEVAAVKAFLSKGGKVITDFAPGEYDELGVKRPQAPFANEKNILILGKIFNDKDESQRKLVFGQLQKDGIKQILGNKDVLTVPGREAMHFVNGKMNVFAVLRNQTRSKDELKQTYVFPVKGYVYDLLAKKYLGEVDSVTAKVPRGGAGVWGVYPYKVESMKISAPGTVKGGTDLVANISIVPSKGKGGTHVFHTELIPPDGSKGRFFMKRNLIGKDGETTLVFRMAENDPKGKWTLRATDVMTGISTEHTFTLR